MPPEVETPAPDLFNEVDPAAKPESSPGTDAQQPAPSTGTQDAAAESSTAKGAEPKSSLDAAIKVLGDRRSKAEEAAAAAKETSPGSEAAKPEGEDAKGSTPAPEGRGEDEKLGKGAERRIKELVRDVKSLEPKAQNWDRLQSWVQSSGLTQDEVVQALTIAHLMRADPHRAYQELAPTLKHLREQVGEILPADLQQEVDDGGLTAERAKEIASRRNAEKNLRRSLEERDQRDERAREEAQVVERVNAVGKAVTEWEHAQSANDPDWPRKANWVLRTLAHMIQTEGAATTPQEAVEQAKRAKSAVEKELKELLPAPRPRTTTTGGAAVQTTAQPKSSLEAARLAVTGAGQRSSA